MLIIQKKRLQSRFFCIYGVNSIVFVVHAPPWPVFVQSVMVALTLWPLGSAAKAGELMV
jgi:hypothetical protein